MEILKTRDDNLFISAPAEVPALRSSYVDLQELVEALGLYFSGQLDNVDNFLERLWMPPQFLIPGKQLLSVLDSDTLSAALKALPLEYSAAIRAYWSDDSASYQVMVRSLPPGMRLLDLHSYYLTEAIQRLAKEVHKLL